jgi:hypothetical protein
MWFFLKVFLFLGIQASKFIANMFVPFYCLPPSPSPTTGKRSPVTRGRAQVPLEPTPSESVSQRGSSRRSAFAPVRGGGQIAYHREGSTRGVNAVGGNGDSGANNAAALLMNFSNINNAILSQILMEASRPKFQDTAEQFSEFRRQ